MQNGARYQAVLELITEIFKDEKPADAPQPVQRPTVEQLARSRTERMAERLHYSLMIRALWLLP